MEWVSHSFCTFMHSDFHVKKTENFLCHIRVFSNYLCTLQQNIFFFKLSTFFVARRRPEAGHRRPDIRHKTLYIGVVHSVQCAMHRAQYAICGA